MKKRALDEFYKDKTVPQRLFEPLSSSLAWSAIPAIAASFMSKKGKGDKAFVHGLLSGLSMLYPYSLVSNEGHHMLNTLTKDDKSMANSIGSSSAGLGAGYLGKTLLNKIYGEDELKDMYGE